MIQVWIWYATFLWVLYDIWTTYDKSGPPHILRHDIQLHLRHTPLLPSAVMLGFLVKNLNNGPHQWCRGWRMIIPTWICYPTVIWVLYEVWTTSPIPQTCSAVILGFVTKSLNHGRHQWCSGPRMMIQVGICYTTVIWVLYEACTTSDRDRSPHRPLYNLELHPRHAQLLPWIL